MAQIIVSGLINQETTIKIEQFPIDYIPVRYAFDGVRSTVSGVGYNLAKALTTLEHDVTLLSLVGQDAIATMVRSELASLGIDDEHVLSVLEATPQSAILYDSEGRRMIHSDLKDIQDTAYPSLDLSLGDVALAILTNINFSRLMLAQFKQARIPIATDVHAISDIDDPYNHDYMQFADILFMSHERLPMAPDAWVHQLWTTFKTPIIGIGLGAEGALIATYEQQQIDHVPAQALRPIVSTVGSGDALFASFLHSYLQTHDALQAMQHAVLFAGYKIGAAGGSDGYMTAAQLGQAYTQHYG